MGSSGELFEAHIYRNLFVCRHDAPAESRKSIVEVRQRRLVGIMFLRRWGKRQLVPGGVGWFYTEHIPYTVMGERLGLYHRC